MRWYAVVNPACGRSRRGAGWTAVSRAIERRGLELEVAHTACEGGGEVLARDAVAAGARAILVAGGDGSVNDVLQGIMHAGLAVTRELTLAVAPLGTGNDWARSLGIDCDPDRIAYTLESGRRTLHDVGAIDFPGSPTQRRWFINVAGAGYDAYVAERVPRPAPSASAYLRGALAGLASYRSPVFRITADEQTVEGRLLLAFVANARYCGHRMDVAPTASTEDGQLDVVAIRELSLMRILPKLMKLYRGGILGDPAVRHERAGSVRIDTQPPVTVQADGQVVGRTPAVFCVVRQALGVLRAPAGR
jgi:diacylglycerol kinase (ATP)